MKRLILTLLCLWPATALGTTILALGERALTERADAVVFGRVITTRTLVNPRAHQIATEADFQVYRVVKENDTFVPGDVIRIQVPGGAAGGFVQKVAGSPELRPGEMFVAFLNGHAERVFTPWGMSYGLLPVSARPDGTLVVSTRQDGLPQAVAAGPAAQEAPLRIEEEPLEQVLVRLAGHLGLDGPVGGSTGTGVAR